MSEKHLCLTCKLAEWKRTENGRLHPNGQGKCRWKPAHIPTPKAWNWGWRHYTELTQPVPRWGEIDRRPRANYLITECETYEAKP